MKKYIHIGYPKNFSTSLQRSFFAIHPEVLHLGIGCHKSNVKYITPEVSSIIEMYIRYSNNSIFQDHAERIQSTFNHFFEKAKRLPEINAVGISAEILSIGFSSQDVDTFEKANRLHKIFGSDTEIIIIIRNQMALLKSFYSELVRLGYPYSYARYNEFMYKFHVSTFTSDLRYDRTIKHYMSLFGEENVKIIVSEEVKDTATKKIIVKDGKNALIDNICNILDIEYLSTDFGHLNQALTTQELAIKRELNKTERHDISNITYDFIESHRLNDYFENDLKMEHYKEPFEDVKTKRKLIKKAQENALVEEFSDFKIDFTCDPEIEQRFYDFFAESNGVLEKIIGKDLSQFKYPK